MWGEGSWAGGQRAVTGWEKALIQVCKIEVNDSSAPLLSVVRNSLEEAVLALDAGRLAPGVLRKLGLVLRCAVSARYPGPGLVRRLQGCGPLNA